MASEIFPHSSSLSLSLSGKIGSGLSRSSRGLRVSIFSQGMMESLTGCCHISRVSFSMVEKPRNTRELSGGGMHWGMWGLEDFLDGMMVRRSRSRRTLVVARAQKSRFFKMYSRSAQDKIQMLVKTLCTSGESAAETLDKHGNWMKPPDWFNVLDGIGRRRRWLLALEVFRWIQIQKWYKADNGYYSKLISIMGKERQYRLAMSIFKEMRKIGCRPDTSIYNSVITVHLRSKDKEQGFTKACSILEEMKLLRRCQPNIVTYNILTRAAAQMGHQEKLDALFKDISDRHLTPDNFTFNGLIDVYGKAGEIAKMEDMFKRLRDDKLKPDIVTFNTLIDAYGKAAEFEKMEQVVWSMTLKRKPPIQPAVKTFNSMITNYGNAGLVEKFESVFQEMRRVGVSPTFVTYEAVIGAYGRCGQFDKMKDCLKRMQSAGFVLQSSTLNKMLDMYCFHGMTIEAETLLKNSVNECGVQATSLSYAIVIRAQTEAGHLSKVEALLDRMKTLGIKPTKQTYLDVMDLIGVDVDYHRAQDDETAGTLTDPDELSSLETVKGANQEFSSYVEDMVGAAA